MRTEIKTINEIRSNNFTTKKDFNKEYKIVKDEFKQQLGHNIMKQGTIILCMSCNNEKFMMITDNSKSDMEDWMKQHEYSNNEYFLLIKEQRFLVKIKDSVPEV